MQSGDEVPVPHREDREICDGMSVTLNKKFSYSSVKNWVA
jgi:hypothetical protein